MSMKSARRSVRPAQLALLSLPVSALVAGAPALAQPANFNWTGMYVGFYAGGVWGRGNSAANSDCPTRDGAGVGGYYCDTTDAGTSANAGAVTGAGSGSVSSGKFTGGIQAGYNRQAGNFVYGVEADFGAFNLQGSRSGSGVYTAFGFGGVPAAGTAFTVTNSFNTDWLFTARGRLGWAVSGWLLYATGGLAISRVEVAYSFSDNFAGGGASGATGSASASKTKVGWTLGGGMEFAVTRNWSIKGEYLYVDLGSLSALGTVSHPGFAGYANALGISTDLTAHIARLGANFRF
jgi:outer membrane immunogenic protein